MEIVLTVYLIIAAIMDVIKRRITVGVLLIGGVLGLTAGFMRVSGTTLPVALLLQGMLPGILLMLLSYTTAMIGYGDSVIVCCMGLALGLRRCLFVLGIGLFLLSVFCIVLVTVRRVKKNSTMPFLPFLLFAFLWIGGA